MPENGDMHTVAGEHVIVKQDGQQAPIEKVEDVRPSWREVAVAVPHFRTVQPGQGLEAVASSYTGDTYVRGFELQSGVVDEETLRNDPRFADDPRLILYTTCVTGREETIFRYDIATRQQTMLQPNNIRADIGRFSAGSLSFQIGGNVWTSTAIEHPPVKHLQDHEISDHVMSGDINRVLVRTSQVLSEQQVTQFRQQGAVNQTARNFGYPQGR